MKAAVISFPGSNCDLDMIHALEIFDISVELVDYRKNDLTNYELIVLPGGFSYGDYLRAGAVARFAPIMNSVIKAARQGKLVIGICNGFQILTEVGLLPGQLMSNEKAGFICDEVSLSIENQNSNYTQSYETKTIKLPIAHGEGRYYADSNTIQKLENDHRVIFRYQTNVNGSVNQIAGIINASGNVMGMMPHPERAVESILGNTDGQEFFKSIQTTFKRRW